MSQPSKREQIIDVAIDLFYKNGFNATGVEKIRETANVSKKTLYNHFKSKDELILTVLRRRDEQFRNDFMRGVESIGKTPRKRLEALFDAAHGWFNREDFCGCMFINASAEFTEADSPCHIVAAEHMRLMRDYIVDIAKKAEVKNPQELARELFLLLQGAIVQAHVSGDKKAAMKAKKMALVFIDRAFT